MSTEYALEQQLEQVTEGFRQAEMARKYKEITEAQGPSQQLIDFINADGKLGEEIGLEGFETFSTGTQHEILLSKLNVDAMEAVAMEGMGDFVKKYAGWLTAGGAVGALTLGGPLWVAILGAGAVGLLLNRGDTVVEKMSEVKKQTTFIDKALLDMKDLVAATPSSGDSVAWESYSNKVSKVVNEMLDNSLDSDESYVMKKVKDSDWTPAGLISLAKWYEGAIKKFETLKKDFASKIEKLDHSDPKEAKALNKALNDVFKSFKNMNYMFTSVKANLDKVAKCYKVKTEA